MPAEQGREAIIDYIAEGCKDADMGRVGLYLDHIVVDEDGDAVPWHGYNMRLGIRDIMLKLSEYYPTTLTDEAGDVVACGRARVIIGVKPGGQLTFGIQPRLAVGAIREEYSHFALRLGQILEEAGYSLETAGYHPGALAEKLGTVPAFAAEERLAAHAGNEALAAFEKGAARTMVAVEFADEADAVRKMRILQLLAPVLAFLGANMPLFEGEATTHPLASLVLKRAAYPASGASAPGLFGADFGFAAYAEWVAGLQAFPPAAGEAHPADTLDAASADVRLDAKIVLDVADAMPPAAAFSFAALVKGLVYSPLGLDMLEHFLGIGGGVCKYGADDVEAAIAAIEADGFEADLYGRTLGSWIDLLYRLAPEGLGTEAELLDDLKEFKGL